MKQCIESKADKIQRGKVMRKQKSKKTPLLHKYTSWLTFLLVAIITTDMEVQTENEAYESAVVDEVTSIYDADTFKANISGWPDIIGKRIPVRVKGIDAPELRGKYKKEIEAAQWAKQKAVTMLRTAKRIELRNLERGKYFRVLADVYLDGVRLGKLLVESGLARPYDGSMRLGWCP